MELVLVKHGEPGEGGLADDGTGLSVAGRAQARQVARRVAVGRWNVLLSSPCRRAVETAEVIAELTGLAVQLDERLAGCSWDECAELRGNDEELGIDANSRYEAESGDRESTDATDMWHRVDEGFVDLTATYRGQNVVAVTHGIVVRASVSRILRTAHLLPHRPSYGSLTRLKLEANGSWGLGSLSETSHLQAR
jgi:broad specificity phosphatase PhoE